MQETELIRRDIHAYLEQHQKKELLRFVTVGSVDDGKSTLIGRLLHDTHGVYEDQLKAVKRASTRLPVSSTSREPSGSAISRISPMAVANDWNCSFPESGSQREPSRRIEIRAIPPARQAANANPILLLDGRAACSPAAVSAGVAGILPAADQIAVIRS